MIDDESFEKQSIRVKGVVVELKQQLGFQGWKFVHRFHRTSNPSGSGTFSSTQAMTYPRWEYTLAEFDWFLPEIADVDDWELRYIVAHELSHLWLSRLVSDNVSGNERKLVELTATEIGHAIVRTEEETMQRMRNAGNSCSSPSQEGG